MLAQRTRLRQGEAVLVNKTADCCSLIEVVYVLSRPVAARFTDWAVLDNGVSDENRRRAAMVTVGPRHVDIRP